MWHKSEPYDATTHDGNLKMETERVPNDTCSTSSYHSSSMHDLINNVENAELKVLTNDEESKSLQPSDAESDTNDSKVSFGMNF